MIVRIKLQTFLLPWVMESWHYKDSVYKLSVESTVQTVEMTNVWRVECPKINSNIHIFYSLIV